jgi:predicted dehydrogenase
VRDAREIARLSGQYGTPFFSSSSRRFSPDIRGLKNNTKLGSILGAMAWGPAPTEPHHPDLFWYGIHTVETLYTLMGTGCETVSRTYSDGADVVVGRWKDGRIGTIRAMREGEASHLYGAIAFGSKAVITSDPPKGSDYRELVVEIVKFFQTGTPPVPADETVEILAFMEAADLSKARGGAPVKLREVNP